jgi:hypothetical protein
MKCRILHHLSFNPSNKFKIDTSKILHHDFSQSLIKLPPKTSSTYFPPKLQITILNHKPQIPHISFIINFPRKKAKTSSNYIPNFQHFSLMQRGMNACGVEEKERNCVLEYYSNIQQMNDLIIAFVATLELKSIALFLLHSSTPFNMTHFGCMRAIL